MKAVPGAYKLGDLCIGRMDPPTPNVAVEACEGGWSLMPSEGLSVCVSGCLYAFTFK